jgi:hypothetical protein
LETKPEVAEPIPPAPMAELAPPAVGRLVEEEDAVEATLLVLEKRLLAPRKAVVAAVVAEPEPVLWTDGVEDASVEEVVELLDEEAEEEDEEDPAPGLPPPAVLTTVTWRTVVLPPVIVTLMPPRLPRNCGTMSEEYFSAAVAPVMRKVLSTLPLAIATVRTADSPDFFCCESLSAE